MEALRYDWINRTKSGSVIESPASKSARYRRQLLLDGVALATIPAKRLNGFPDLFPSHRHDDGSVLNRLRQSADPGYDHGAPGRKEPGFVIIADIAEDMSTFPTMARIDDAA